MNLPSPTVFRLRGSNLSLEKRGWLGQRIVVGRSKCVHFRLDTTGVPWLKTGSFVRVQLNLYKLYLDTGFFAIRGAGCVHLWAWDNAPLRDTVLAANLTWDQVQFVPESVCKLSSPAGPGQAALVECLDSGFEGLLWGTGGVADFAWWPQMPTAQEWKSFCNQALPLVQKRFTSAVLLAQPLNFLPRQSASLLWILDAGWVLACLWSLLAGYAGYLGGQALGMQRLTASALSAYDTLYAGAQSVVQARDQALNDNAWVAGLEAFRDSPDLLKLWTELGETLTLNGMALREFDYRTGELRMTIVSTGKRIDAPLLLRLLESSPVLKQIRLELNAAMRDVRVLAKWKSEEVSPP